MSATLWWLVGAIAVMAALTKAAGPVVLGGRELPGWLTRVVALLPPALLAALVLTQLLAKDGQLGIDAAAVGVACAGIVFLRGGSVLVGVLVAVAVTAGLRAVLPT
ncbi:MAG: AzlD domain-containing protein [Pseudonocardia sp.]|jgi:branched-subunit amino acid transport protein